MPLLPETISRVDELVAGAQTRGRAPSLVACVVRGGEVVHFTGAGDLPRPDANTQYRIGSISKTMTAALILAARDEGRLGLDEPLQRHLPGTPFGAVTLRQLLGHVGGLQREPDGEWWERAPGLGPEALLAGLTQEKLAFRPFTQHHYSNLAYGLLGSVLARVTGQDWATLLSMRLFEPLRMGRTTYHATEPFARGYVVHPWHGTLREEPRHDAGAMAPAGQLWSTTADLAKWAAFLANPDPGVLAAATVTEMCAPVVMSDPEEWTAGHGLGLQLWRHGERVYIGHSGSMPGYLAILMVHRRSRTAVIAYANAYTLHGGGIIRLGMDLLTAVVEREPAPAAAWRPGAAPPGDAETLTGRWWWMGREYQAAWDASKRELVITPVTSPGPPWRFTADGPDRWRGRSGMNDGEVLRVRRSRSGGVVALDIATFVYTRDPWPPM